MSRLCPLLGPNEAMAARGPDGSVAPLSMTRAPLLERPTKGASRRRRRNGWLSASRRGYANGGRSMPGRGREPDSGSAPLTSLSMEVVYECHCDRSWSCGDGERLLLLNEVG